MLETCKCVKCGKEFMHEYKIGKHKQCCDQCIRERERDYSRKHSKIFSERRKKELLEKKKERDKMNIAKLNDEARSQGMTYGTYVSMLYCNKQKKAAACVGAQTTA